MGCYYSDLHNKEVTSIEKYALQNIAKAPAYVVSFTYFQCGWDNYCSKAKLRIKPLYSYKNYLDHLLWYHDAYQYTYFITRQTLEKLLLIDYLFGEMRLFVYNGTILYKHFVEHCLDQKYWPIVKQFQDEVIGILRNERTNDKDMLFDRPPEYEEPLPPAY